MSVGALIADLVEAGVSAELIGRVAEALAARPVTTVEIRDQQAERRREKDRERQRVRRHPQTSAESADPSLETKVSPAPLQKLNPSQPPSPPKGGSSPIASLAFARFWEAYPRKVAKDAASRAFDKAIRRITEPDPATIILGGLERAKAGWHDPQFIPHAATWLNRGQWADEPDLPLNLTSPTNGHREPKPSDAFARKQANLARAFNAVSPLSR